MEKYKGTIQVCMETRKLDVNLSMELNVQKDSHNLTFYLPTETKIHNVFSELPLEYTLTEDKDWCPLVSGDKKLCVTLPKGRVDEKLVLNVDYTSWITNIPEGGMNQFDKDIMEIGVYVPWFPLQAHFPETVFDMTIKNTDLTYVGSYKIKNTQDVQLKSPNASVGYPLIASKDFNNKIHKLKVFNSEISVYYTHKVQSHIVDELVSSIGKIIKLYSNLFGETSFESLHIYLSPRQNTDAGGGYCRPGLIVLPCGENTSTSIKYSVNEDLYMYKYLAHELGHLWWSSANVDSWENWLNESFAEFSCLLAIRDLKGDAEFDRIISEYKNESVGLGPIKGCDTHNEDYFSIWYMKGPYILSQLEAYMGQTQFLDLLQNLSRMKVKTTKGVLELLKGDLVKFLNDMLES